MKFNHKYTIVFESNSPAVLFDDKLINELKKTNFKIEHHTTEAIKEEKEFSYFENKFLNRN